MKPEIKPRGRTPATLNIAKAPGVGMAYLASTKDEKHKLIILRVGTTCARDVHPGKAGELIGAQLTNFSGVPDKGLGEKYFIAKLGRKGNFKYLLFLCSPHHKKCMGAEVKVKELMRDTIGATIAKILKSAEADGAKKDSEDRLVIGGFQGSLEFEWLDKSYQDGKAENLAIYELNKQGAYEQIDAPKAAKVPKVKEAKPAKPKKAPAKKEVKPKKAPAKKEAKPKKAPAKKEVKPKKAAKAVVDKPAKKDNRIAFFGIKDGKAITKRSAVKPEGFYDTKEERDAAMVPAQAASASAEQPAE